MHIVIDIINILLYTYITFMLTCVKLQFRDPSREIGRLFSNCFRNIRLKLEISSVNVRLKMFAF